MPKKDGSPGLADGIRAIEVVVYRWIGEKMQGALWTGIFKITWGVPCKRVYPKPKEEYAIDAFIPMNGEGCMSQATEYKRFSNRDIKILFMNKTQKYLRYWVQIFCGCSASITFYEWNSKSIIWPPRARLQPRQ